jgi:pimeloyl-ACP methyl ester carboxylesterase
MPEFARGDVRLHYEVYGTSREPPPVLLSHGFSASGRMWDANVGALCGERRAITWDMRGHADSDAPADPSAYGVEQSVGDMAALLDLLGVRRAVLVGMSLGGYLSLAFHARHPERVAALILLDTGPGFRSQDSRREWNEYAERMAAEIDREGPAALADRPEVGDHRDGVGLAHTARLVMAQQDAHVIESLATIEVPTLVVVGALDTSFLGAADYMAAKIPGAREVVLEGAGHAANIDAAHAFNEAAVEFLRSV